MTTVLDSQMKKNIAGSTAEPVIINDNRSAVRPMQLDTIDLANCVLQLIEKGVTAEEPVRCLEGEYSLVGALLHLFNEFGWIIMRGSEWKLTAIGAENIFRFQRRT